MRKNLIALSLLLLALIPENAKAGLFEISFGFSFSRTNYSEVDFTWNRRWSASAGYYFTTTSSVELSFQSVTTRTYVSNLQNTVFKDKIYSLNWVQSFLSRKSPIRPYFKFGLGQLDRTATGSYSGGGTPPAELLALSIVMSLGLKWFVLRNFAIKMEGTSYLPRGSMRTFGDNFAVQFGTSVFF